MLFQPVDGMDKIWRGFLRTPVGKRVRYRREVTGVFNFDDGGTPKVRVTHRPTGAGGGDEQIVADWCISTIPVPILARVKHNFGADFRAAIAAVAFADTCKVAWQTSSRFWETQHQIYGGISYCTDNITQMWYPSCGYLGRKGILTGAYNYDDDARLMASLDLKARLTLAMKGGRKVHPDFDSHVPADLGVSIAWKQVPHQLGGWAEHWDCDDPVYNRLLRPEGRVFVAGDQVGQLTGWQEGAVRSAHHVMAGITGVRAETPIPTAAPATVSRRRAPTVGRRTRGLP